VKAFPALVWHEIRERRALLAAAAVAGLLPLLAPLLPTTGSNPPEDIREAVLWVMVLGLVPVFALLLGLTFIGRDLGEGRLGFYYAQPISGSSLWFGKLSAVVLLVWAAQLLIMLPTVLLSSDPLRFLVLPNVLDPFVPKWLVPATGLLASVAIVLIAHAAGVIWRARSVWLVVDTIALLVVVAMAWLAISPFYPLVAPGIAIGAAWWVMGWALIGLTAAGAVQVGAGRVDPRRCHRVLSTTLWAILLASTAVLLGWAGWVRAARLADLDRAETIATGPGDWIAVTGSSTGRFDFRPVFLVNASDGRSIRIAPKTEWYWPEIELSEDGSTAVWLAPDGTLSSMLMAADLSASQPAPAPTGITIGSYGADFTVSDDGSRIAVLEGGTLAVYQGRPAEQLAAVRIPDALDPDDLLFDDPDTLRVVATSRESGSTGDTRWWLLWFDVADRRLTDRVEIASPWRWGKYDLAGRTDHPLTTIEVGEHSHVAIRDPETGEVVRDLGVQSFWNVRFLGGGRILAVHDRGDDNRLEVYSPTGEAVATIDLPETDEVFDAGMVAPERLLIGLVDSPGEGPERRERYRTLAVDLRAGTCSVVSNGHLPVLGRYGIWTTSGSWAVGSTASRLLRGESGSLELLNPDTGELERVIPVPG
jgi:hypothetical protein